MGRPWLAAALGLIVGTFAAAQPVPTVASKGVWDWPSGTFTLTITAPLTAASNLPPPQRRYLAEKDVQRVIPQEFVRQVGSLPADSGRTLKELMDADPALQSAVSQLGGRLTFISSNVDDNYSQLTMVWSASLWKSLAPLLEDSEQANPVPTMLLWAPSRDFSGLVIFAMGKLPWVGTSFQSEWKPSLRFRLLNPQGEVVFDPSMVTPAAWTRWGEAGFSQGLFNEEPWRDRIGYDPLRIVAWGVWGAHASDLVLSNADWDRVLSRDANRQLLADGKILILWGPFPDYSHHPNPDSAIDETKPPVEVIPEAPPVDASPPPSSGE